MPQILSQEIINFRFQKDWLKYFGSPKFLRQGIFGSFTNWLIFKLTNAWQNFSFLWPIFKAVWFLQGLKKSLKKQI